MVVPFTVDGERIKLDILVDRGSIEVFGDNGRVAISAASLMKAGETSHTVSLALTGEGSKPRVLTISELKSAW